MDLIAARLGLDRAEVRRRNLITPEMMPYIKKLKTRSGASMVYDSGDYPASQAEALAAAGWDDFPGRQKRATVIGKYLKQNPGENSRVWLSRWLHSRLPGDVRERVMTLYTAIGSAQNR